MTANYSEDSIRTLVWKEHIRKRPGMYIGKLGDGSSHDDGIYILIKEVIDNSIDEFAMGIGKSIHVDITDRMVSIRDYGRGIPLGKVIDVTSKMNTGAKYDSAVFKKSVGLNGVGIKAVNALSTEFIVESFREGELKKATFCRGELLSEDEIQASEEKYGVRITVQPDKEMFSNYRFTSEYIETMLKNYVY